ncbi:MAG TPA: hypothetical protein VK844_00155, partial [Hyphomicrobiales bacterium]|nr:hypothetical protein [Hyphomicrobiales bacterium]
MVLGGSRRRVHHANNAPGGKQDDESEAKPTAPSVLYFSAEPIHCRTRSAESVAMPRGIITIIAVV